MWFPGFDADYADFTSCRPLNPPLVFFQSYTHSIQLPVFSSACLNKSYQSLYPRHRVAKSCRKILLGLASRKQHERNQRGIEEYYENDRVVYNLSFNVFFEILDFLSMKLYFEAHFPSAHVGTLHIECA